MIARAFSSDGPTSRRMLFIPLAGFAILVTVHAIYWFYAAGRIHERGEAWIEMQRAAGYEIAYERMRVAGYPFRFTIRIDEPDIQAPAADGGWRAQAPRFAASAQLLNFNHWIASFDGPLMLDTTIEGAPARYEIDARDARVSLSGSRGATRRVGAEINSLEIAAHAGPQPSANAVERLRISGLLTAEDRLLVSVEAIDAALAAEVFDPRVLATFGSLVSTIRLEAELSDWSVLAAEGDISQWRSAGGRIDVQRAELAWGPADLAGAGGFTLDDSFLPTGRLSVIVTDPDTLVGALVDAGMIDADQGDALQLAALMAPRRGGGLALPFRLQDGAVFLGPARLGRIAAPD